MTVDDRGPGYEEPRAPEGVRRRPRRGRTGSPPPPTRSLMALECRRPPGRGAPSSTAARGAGTATTTPWTASPPFRPTVPRRALRTPGPRPSFRIHRATPNATSFGRASAARVTASTSTPVWMITPRRSNSSARCPARLAVLPDIVQKRGRAVPAGRRGCPARAAPRHRIRLPAGGSRPGAPGRWRPRSSSSTPPAWIPPTSGSTSRSTTGRPRRASTISPTDRSPMARFDPRWG